MIKTEIINEPLWFIADEKKKEALLANFKYVKVGYTN